MIAISCLLLCVGLADLIRARSPRLAVLLVAGVVGTAALVTLQVLFGVDPLVLALSVVVLLVWMLGTSRPSFTTRKIAVATLAAALLAGIVLAPASTAVAAVQQWYSGLGYVALAGVPLGQALTIVAVAVFLIESANIVVRTVLELPDDEDAARSTRRRLGARRPAPAPLKGGRLIGPLERIFLLALALAGQFTAIGAIVAAKGIVRFPELSRDTGRGSNAELFLVGSFTSWALVLGAVLFVRLAG